MTGACGATTFVWAPGFALQVAWMLSMSGYFLVFLLDEQVDCLDTE